MLVGMSVLKKMNRKEVDYYFRNHTTSSTFTPLREKIEEAVSIGLVDADQAAQDLA